MALLKVDKTRLTEPMFSRYHSPDRRLYTEREMVQFMVERDNRNRNPWRWWEYDPEGPVAPLPIRPLNAQDRNFIERWLPF